MPDQSHHVVQVIFKSGLPSLFPEMSPCLCCVSSVWVSVSLKIREESMTVFDIIENVSFDAFVCMWT